MILRDAVHGLLSFEQPEESLVPMLLGTAEVQRLRRIRQLGLTSLAFPGAEHTRFSHALGAAHVMKLFLARLRQFPVAPAFALTPERAEEALAAALLHDLGHGPLSHLFETAMPGAEDHERWTERILLDPSTEVHQVLAKRRPELPALVAGLVDGRHPLPCLTHTVSGMFDVDRCDYLLRDAHATGVRYGLYDLEWLVRSLIVTGDDVPILGIDGSKGLSAVESFILARLFMFQQIYFHKATRAAEWMIGVILRRAAQLLSDGSGFSTRLGALTAAASGRRPTPGEYLDLDDMSLLMGMRDWENSSDAILSDLCKRLRARRLFKTVEIFAPDGATGINPAVAEEALVRAKEIARRAGLSEEHHVGLDVASDVPFDAGSSPPVRIQGRRMVPLREASFLLGRLSDQAMSRTRLIVAEELRNDVARAVEALIPART